MRALNEGDVGISTIVRLEERALSQIRAMGARVTIGAGVTLAQILRERDLAFLHAPARSIGGPAVRTMATVGGNLFAPSPYGDLTVALLALDATVSVMSGYGARDMALEEFLAGRDRAAAGDRSQRLLRPPAQPGGVSLPQGRPGQAEGRLRPLDRRHRSAVGGRVVRGAHRLWRHGADRDPRQGGRARPRRPHPGRIGRRRRGRGRRRGNLPGRPTRSPAPGIGAKWSACICAACSLDVTAEERLLPMPKTPLQFRHNGREVAVFVDGGANLLTALREELGDFSPKFGCGQGGCGACTVLIDGEPALSCLILAESVAGKSIETADGLKNGPELHPLQTEFMDNFAAQCGYCTPGMLMAAKALLDRNPTPSRVEVIEAISGNICRCTGYEPIINAIVAAAARGAQRRA